MKKPTKKETLNLVLSAFLILGYIVCCYFFLTMSATAPQLDPYVQALVPDRDFATQGAEPCIVFINGEYWGIYSITEDYSDNYIEDNYGVDDKNAQFSGRRVHRGLYKTKSGIK